MSLSRCSHEHIEVLVGGNGDFLFFRQREATWVPTLRLLHKCKLGNSRPNELYCKCHPTLYFVSDPFILPWQQVDKGAIRFVLSGANIMCPGLTSPGAKMTNSPKGTVVVKSHFKQFLRTVTDPEFHLTGNHGGRKAACRCSWDNSDVY